MSEYTPGPWELGYLDDKGGAFEIGIGYDESGIVRGNGYVITSRGPVYHKAEEMKANARLIAAAPDLLSALEAACAVADIGESDIRGLDWKQIEAAIAKAKG